MTKKCSVIVADDNSSTLERIKTSFQNLPVELELVTCPTQEEAAAELAYRKPDLLIVDYYSAKCSGRPLLENLEDIKSEQRPSHILAIADIRDRGYLNIDLHGLNYVQKNHSAQELASAISSILELQPKKKLDPGFILPFLEATCHVLKVMAQTDSQREAVVFARNSDIRGIAAVVPIISTDFYGSLAISFEESCFLSIVSKMLGENYTQMSDELNDAAAEICNQILGQAKTKLNEVGHHIQPAIPQVARGKDIPHTTEGQCLSVAFKTDAGRFVVETVIQ